jgi:hypothetical protein
MGDGMQMGGMNGWLPTNPWQLTSTPSGSNQPTDASSATNIEDSQFTVKLCMHLLCVVGTFACSASGAGCQSVYLVALIVDLIL